MKRIALLRAAPLSLLLAAVVHAQTNPGAELFNASCAICHGGDGRGSVQAPTLIKRVTGANDDELTAFLKTGNPQKGMPPAPVSAAQMPALVGYLRLLASNVPDTASELDNTSNKYASMPAIRNFVPVTDDILNHPGPNDWLWFSRTPDAQRFSPLDQINKGNVKQLGLAWSRGLPAGITETIPTVYNGVMYLTLPGSTVAAFDATTGDLIWEYRRDYSASNAGGSGRSKTLAIYEDMIYFAAPDEMLVALDARTGAVRWEAPTPGRGNTSGAIVAKGKVVTGGTCNGKRENCYVSAHDARTGKLAWKFFTAQAPSDPPGYDTWGGVDVDARKASTWGLPGSYDPETGILYWSVANPSPYTRIARHGGDADKIPETAPADLYSNSTLALDPDTGKLKWYYQHLPGDDWDEDINEERVILKTPLNPDPRYVKWINPDVKKGEKRDIIVNVGEGGGLFALDKRTGQFLWATPFPSDVENFIIKDIDVHTGVTRINRSLVANKPGDRHLVCFFNTRSYWPTSYNPKNNMLYVPYINNCLDMTAGDNRGGGAEFQFGNFGNQQQGNSAGGSGQAQGARNGGNRTGGNFNGGNRNRNGGNGANAGRFESRVGKPLPGISMAELNGLARINMETGEITHWPTGEIPTNSAMLATAGDVVFWGDINRRYRAIDADSGKTLWETVLGAPISNSNITYSVNGKQYVAVIAGENMSHPGLNTGTMGPMRLNLGDTFGSNTLYVFALPDKK